MSNYIYTNDGLVNADELMHYGVPGMRWGKRKNRYAGVSTDGSKRKAAEKARRDLIAAKRNKKSASRDFDKAYNKANNRAIAGLSPMKKHREANNKRWEAVGDAGEKSAKADIQYKAAKKAYKAAKKMANIEAKAVKQKYKDEYMKGASAAGKIYAKLTDAHKYYADMQYNINNGAYKKSK